MEDAHLYTDTPTYRFTLKNPSILLWRPEFLETGHVLSGNNVELSVCITVHIHKNSCSECFN